MDGGTETTTANMKDLLRQPPVTTMKDLPDADFVRRFALKAGWSSPVAIPSTKAVVVAVVVKEPPKLKAVDTRKKIYGKRDGKPRTAECPVCHRIITVIKNPRKQFLAIHYAKGQFKPACVGSFQKV